MDKEAMDKVIARVRKLLALAGNNPNEHEAASAAERAQVMLAEYNLTLAEVQARDNTEDHFEYDATLKTPSRPWRRQLASMVAMMYFCKYFYTFDYHYTTKRACGYVRDDIHNFVGARHNLVVARMIYEYLIETIERLAIEGSKTLPAKERVSYRTSFQHTCASRLCYRIQSRINDAKENKVKSEGMGTALVLADLYAVTEEKITDFITKSHGKLKESKSRAKINHAGGAHDGREAGDKISIDKQIAPDKHVRIGGV